MRLTGAGCDVVFASRYKTMGAWSDVSYRSLWSWGVTVAWFGVLPRVLVGVSRYRAMGAECELVRSCVGTSRCGVTAVSFSVARRSWDGVRRCGATLADVALVSFLLVVNPLT